MDNEGHPGDRTSKALHAAKAVLLLAIVGGAAVLGYVYRERLDLAGLEGALDGLGILGSLLVVTLYALGVASLLPGAILVLGVALLYPYWEAVLYVTLGSLLGGIACFGLARGLGRGFVARLLHHPVATSDEDLSRHGIATVFVLRVLMVPYAVVSYGAGLSRMRFRHFLLGTVLGVMPSVLLFVRLYQKLGRAASLDELVSSVELWLLLAGIVVLVAGGLVARRRLRAKGRLAVEEVDDDDA